jgi:hypothetical protein
VLEVAIMIEGQDGTSSRRWCRLARVAEDLDFSGLYRSDHFTNPPIPISTRSNFGPHLPGSPTTRAGSSLVPLFLLSRSATQSFLPGRRLLSTTCLAVGSGSAWAPVGRNASTEPMTSSCWTPTAVAPVRGGPRGYILAPAQRIARLVRRRVLATARCRADAAAARCRRQRCQPNATLGSSLRRRTERRFLLSKAVLRAEGPPGRAASSGGTSAGAGTPEADDGRSLRPHSRRGGAQAGRRAARATPRRTRSSSTSALWQRLACNR